MSLEREFSGAFKEIIDKFDSDEGVVTLEKDMGTFVCVRLANGKYRSKYFYTMFFAKRRFNRLRDMYAKEEEV